MAILSEYPGLDVAVVVHDQRLQEYDDDDEPSPTTVTKYIEAQSGANFAIATSFKPPFPTHYDVMAKLYIDGKRMSKWHCRREQLFDREYKKDNICWQQHGEWFKQKFCFAELNIGKQ